jgi:hypothetical protein
MSAGARSRLETSGQIAFIVMCVAVAGAAVRYALTRQDVTVPARPPAVAVGATIAGAEKFNGDPPAKAVLILGLSTNCKFCTDSLPFYARLAALEPVKSGRVRLSVASVQEVDQMSSYLRLHNLSISPIVTFGQTSLRIAVTPTIILMSRDGTVLETWEGRLDARAEARVLDAATGVN